MQKKEIFELPTKGREGAKFRGPIWAATIVGLLSRSETKKGFGGRGAEVRPVRGVRDFSKNRGDA